MGHFDFMIKRKCCWDTLILDHDKAFQWKLTDKNRFEKKGRKRRGKTRDSRWQITSKLSEKGLMLMVKAKADLHLWENENRESDPRLKLLLYLFLYFFHSKFLFLF